MPSREPQTHVSRRRLVAVAAAVGWVLVVIVGAGASANDSLLGADRLGDVWTIFLGTAVLASLALVIYVNPFSGGWAPPEKSQGNYGLIIFIVIVAALAVWRPNFLTEILEDEDFPDLAELFDTQIDATPEEAAPDTVAQATDLLLIAAVLALLGGLWYYVRRRFRAGDSADEHVLTDVSEEDLALALDQAWQELAITGDPRTAVLRAYAVLEQVLATHGSTRTRSETPAEHVRRSMQHLRVESAPLVQLGRLYEIARFSDHPITAEQQADAMRALDRTRSSLAARQ